MNGKIISVFEVENTETIVPVQDLVNGNYILEIITKEGTFNKQFVKMI